MRYLAGLLGLVLIVVFFFIGFKLGLFFFEQETQINADNKQTDADNISENQRENPRESPTYLYVGNESAFEKNLCAEGVEFLNKDDEKFCFQEPKLTESRGLAVDLTNNKALLYEQGKLIKIFPLFYQAPEDRWFQAPTGYFRTGVKREKHLSSLFPVVMPYSIQYYEDFFIHGIPYYRDGKDVSSQFTGGCLRFENNFAKEIYDFLKTGDQIVVYKTFDDLKIKSEFHPPVESENFFIERRFLNPYRKTRYFGGTSILKEDYYQHTGIDLRPTTDKLQQVYAIYEGKIAKIQLNNGSDHGLGNTIIIEHLINGEKLYSLYAHLASIKEELKEGDIIKEGGVIGEVGNSGFGCQNYWRIGKDGCDSQTPPDTHLHFEIKKTPVLGNPEGEGFYYGYTPDYPQKYGYLNPIEFIFE